jgi:hypothetical protein
MKRFFLLALGACALAGNVKAQTETVWQQVGRALDTQAQVDVVREQRMQRQEARQNAIDFAEARALAEQQAQERALAALIKKAADDKAFVEACRAQSARREAVGYPNGPKFNPALTEGDPIPSIANLYDDEAAIRLYLHDSGYSDLSDGEIAKVRAYMHAHGIRHVSQLGQ